MAGPSSTLTDPFGSRETFWAFLENRTGGQAILSGSYQAAWRRGGLERRTNVLIYLTRAMPADGFEIIRRAMRIDAPGIATLATVAAYKYVLAGFVLTPKLRAAVEEAVQMLPNISDRAFAILILEAAGGEETAPFLRQVAAEDPSAQVRFQANLSLAKLGNRDVKEALLSSMHQHERGEVVAATYLWPQRQDLDLTAEEDAELRRLIVRHMDDLRESAGRFEAEAPTRKALSLFAWIKQGLPYTDADIDLIAAGATSEFDLADRIRSVEALGWFDSPRAREWLTRLQGEEYEEAIRQAAERVTGGLESSNHGSPLPRPGEG